MTFEEFHEDATPAKPTEAYDGTLFWSNGLGGEAGEVQNEVKKMIRDNENRDFQILSECGDVLFYMRQLLEDRGLNMLDAAEVCLAKLAAKRAEYVSHAE